MRISYQELILIRKIGYTVARTLLLLLSHFITLSRAIVQRNPFHKWTMCARGPFPVHCPALIFCFRFRSRRGPPIRHRAKLQRKWLTHGHRGHSVKWGRFAKNNGPFLVQVKFRCLFVVWVQRCLNVSLLRALLCFRLWVKNHEKQCNRLIEMAGFAYKQVC